MGIELMFGEGKKLVLDFSEAEKLMIWRMMMSHVAG